MATNYRPDHRGMRNLAQSAGIGQAMQQAAQAGKQWAEANAPRDSGEYANSFSITPATVRGGRDNEDRAGAALVNSANHAGIVEWRHNVLARAVNAIEGQRG